MHLVLHVVAIGFLLLQEQQYFRHTQVPFKPLASFDRCRTTSRGSAIAPIRENLNEEFPQRGRPPGYPSARASSSLPIGMASST